jgi:hypothetical protein
LNFYWDENKDQDEEQEEKIISQLSNNLRE